MNTHTHTDTHIYIRVHTHVHGHTHAHKVVSAYTHTHIQMLEEMGWIWQNVRRKNKTVENTFDGLFICQHVSIQFYQNYLILRNDRINFDSIRSQLEIFIRVCRSC